MDEDGGSGREPLPPSLVVNVKLENTQHAQRLPYNVAVDAHAGELAALLTALGSETRLEILAQIRTPKRLGDIQARALRGYGNTHRARTISRQAVARHLDVLIEAGLVEARTTVDGVAFVALTQSLDARLAQLGSVIEQRLAPQRMDTDASNGDGPRPFSGPQPVDPDVSGGAAPI